MDDRIPNICPRVRIPDPRCYTLDGKRQGTHVSSSTPEVYSLRRIRHSSLVPTTPYSSRYLQECSLSAKLSYSWTPKPPKPLYRHPVQLSTLSGRSQSTHQTPYSPSYLRIELLTHLPLSPTLPKNLTFRSSPSSSSIPEGTHQTQYLSSEYPLAWRSGEKNISEKTFRSTSSSLIFLFLSHGPGTSYSSQILSNRCVV
jgi:hypothetical protein